MIRIYWTDRGESIDLADSAAFAFTISYKPRESRERKPIKAFSPWRLTVLRALVSHLSGFRLIRPATLREDMTGGVTGTAA